MPHPYRTLASTPPRDRRTHRAFPAIVAHALLVASLLELVAACWWWGAPRVGVPLALAAALTHVAGVIGGGR